MAEVEIGRNLMLTMIITGLCIVIGVVIYTGYNHGTVTLIIGIIAFLLGVPIGLGAKKVQENK